MPRDYKSRAHSRKRQQRRPVPGWVWFLGGLLVGLFFSGLAWLKLLPPPAGTVMNERERLPAGPKATVPVAPAASGMPPKPRYDFYTILPEMEVVVPDPEPEPEPAPRQAPTAPTDTPAARTPERTVPPPAVDRYMLQMGSFRKHFDADRLKASLALAGIQAEIQEVEIDNKDTYYRVRSGPYNRKKVNLLRSKLAQNKIRSLVIKLK